jgi:predicted RNase H-like nuclease
VLAVGVDGWRSAWVAVALVDGSVHQVAVFATLADAVAAHAAAEVLAVDVPIGLPDCGRRAADVAAKDLLGPRASTVFYAPPRLTIARPTYQEANDLAWRLCGHGVSAQAYRLGSKILEAEAVTVADPRVVEAHPELSFAAMAGGPLRSSKKSWNGQAERRSLLRNAGIAPDDVLPGRAGEAPVDDVLDAAAAAWTAQRVAAGEARSVPDPPEVIGGRRVAIWV